MAKILYELAAQQGDASAMTDLGFLYENGKEVLSSHTKKHLNIMNKLHIWDLLMHNTIWDVCTRKVKALQ
jgi:TPR repeat protein